SDCAFIVCQALASEAEVAQRRTFYTFLERFSSRHDKEWLIQLVRDRLGATAARVRPAGQAQAAAEPAGRAQAAAEALADDRPLSIDQALPVGTVLAYAGELPYDLKPRGWLVCDGHAELATDYEELFRAIGYTFGAQSTSVPKFNKPELSGRFIRSTAPDLAKRKERDPEWAERFNRYPHGATGANVGSYQGYGTARPVKSFSASFEKLDIYKTTDAAGCGSNPASYHDGSVTFPLYGGDAETRPKNKYVYFIIKASSLTADGSP